MLILTSKRDAEKSTQKKDRVNSIVIIIFLYAHKQITAESEFEIEVLWRTIRKENN